METTTAEPTAPIRRLYDGLATGDLDAALASCTADTVLHVPGTGINAGTYEGRDRLREFLIAAATATAGSLRMTLNRAFADDEWGVALATYTATRPGQDVVLENTLAHVVRLEDGLIAESWLQARDQYAVDAFWAARP